MRAILCALVMLVALPAQAMTYEFSGTCTERLFLDNDVSSEWVSQPCASPSVQIKMPGDYVPGTEISAGWFDPWLIEISISDRGWGGAFFAAGSLPEEPSYVANMPEVEGPGALHVRFFVGYFRVDEDGTWKFASEGTFPTYYDISGTDGRFTLLQAVPTPGTLALLLAAVISPLLRRGLGSAIRGGG